MWVDNETKYTYVWWLGVDVVEIRSAAKKLLWFFEEKQKLKDSIILNRSGNGCPDYPQYDVAVDLWQQKYNNGAD